MIKSLFGSDDAKKVSSKVQNIFGKYKEAITTNLEKVGEKIKTDKWVGGSTEKPGEKPSPAKVNVSKEPAYQVDKIIKSYTKWFLYVVQEPSLGLYYVQNHFKDSLDKTIENKKEVDTFGKKLNWDSKDMSRTVEELKEINTLNQEWAHNMTQLLDEFKTLSK